jgi:hypothetical protein
LPEVLSQIRELMLLGDPITLYGQLHWFDALRRMNTSAPEHFGSDALLEFFGGLVVSLPQSDVLERIGRSGPIDLVLRLDAALQAFGSLELTSDGTTCTEGPHTTYQVGQISTSSSCCLTRRS